MRQQVKPTKSRPWPLAVNYGIFVLKNLRRTEQNTLDWKHVVQFVSKTANGQGTVMQTSQEDLVQRKNERAEDLLWAQKQICYDFIKLHKSVHCRLLEYSNRTDFTAHIPSKAATV
jgi:hypothetical protein